MTPFEALRACDPTLAPVLEKIGPLDGPESPRDDHFAALARIIVGQQLSTTVARAIWKRVETFFGENPAPHAVLNASHDDLRALGLSGAKARSLVSLAQHISEGKLKVDELERLSDAEIAREITAVKGLGPWSCDMFLMFHLNRPDILPVGDLGIREAIKRLYALPERPAAAKMEEISLPWRPHRTLACRYLWKWLDQK